MESAPADKIVELKVKNINPHLRVINLLQCRAGFDTGPRKLYNYYFLYVHSGKGRVEIGGIWHDAVPGVMFFCPPAVSNTIVADVDNPFLLSGIDFDFTMNNVDAKRLLPIASEKFNPDNVLEYVKITDFEGFPVRMVIPEESGIRDIILNMVHQFNIKRRYYEHYVDGLLKALIIALIQRIVSAEPGNEKDNRGDRIVRYLADNYMRDISNEDIGRMFHYNPDYVNRIVLAHTGLTLRQYLIDLRIREAINLLLNTGMSISCIASKVGYDNIQYFSRLFKHKTGHSPGYLRNKLAKQQE